MKFLVDVCAGHGLAEWLRSQEHVCWRYVTVTALLEKETKTQSSLHFNF